VAVGHDENIQLLKGEGHPMFPQDERLYMVQAIRFVTQALMTSGHGWMDASSGDRPDSARHLCLLTRMATNPKSRSFDKEHGLEYVVLKRTPKDGLPRRESTTLRGF